jgi:hypothetical protein
MASLAALKSLVANRLKPNSALRDLIMSGSNEIPIDEAKLKP